MTAAVLVRVSEYLDHMYHPDCDYLEGILEERHVGELSHSVAQTALALICDIVCPASGPASESESRSNLSYRVPDVTIVRGGKPAGRIIVTPPEVVVEVLSPEDRIANLQESIDDYLAFGISCVWVINPEMRRAWVHTSDGSRQAKDGVLRNLAGDWELPLSAVFAE